MGIVRFRQQPDSPGFSLANANGIYTRTILMQTVFANHIKGQSERRGKQEGKKSRKGKQERIVSKNGRQVERRRDKH